MQYIRSGKKQNPGKPQEDFFRIDNDGNILNDVIWNFDNISSIVLVPIPEEQIIVQNGNFQTNHSENGKESSGGYMKRNIICYRSNTIIKNINHSLSDNDALGGPYYGFIWIESATNVKVEDCHLVAHKYIKNSTYDLIIQNATNIEFENVTSDNIEETDRWGIVGSNISYKKCKLNRIDAHCGVHNLDITDCEIGIYGISVVGSGELNITNTKGFGKNGFISLRSDFGSTWNGNINIRNCTYRKANLSKVFYLKITYDNEVEHDYGYKLYLPNVYIDGFTIEDENIPNTTKGFCIFGNSKNYTNKENGELRNNYILPSNIIIKNYTTTKGRKLQLFSTKFYNNIEELGINLSMPLKDKKEALIFDEEGKTITNNQITNKKVMIKKQEVEGIKTVVKINNQEKTENQTILSDDGDYKIDIIYQNTAGDKETKTTNVIIDKTPPTILGVKEGYTYKNSATPRIEEKHLKSAVLSLNGQVVQNYKAGTTLYEEGIYKLTAIDQVGNTAEINFQILESTEEDYKIINQTIRNIDAQTTKMAFTKKFASSEIFTIKRGTNILDSNSVIKTGDILETNSGKKYTLIVKGDINKDGLTDIKDIVKLRKYLLQISTLTDIEKMAADTNLDNQTISIKDLVRMRIIILTKKMG